MPTKLNLVLAAFLPLFVSCEKAIGFRPDDAQPRLVVDASIESGGPPVVMLSRSLGYFSDISPELLDASFVHDAGVVVSDGDETHVLREYEIDAGNGFSIFYYSVDSSGSGAQFKGRKGAGYTLSIDYDGNQYTAQTTIPASGRTLDSLYYRTGTDEEDSTKVILFGKFTDPPGLGNYTRYFTSVNDGPYMPGLNSVEDDQVTDGRVYRVQIAQGLDRNAETDFEEYAYFGKGDRISVKFCQITKPVFDFWRTMEYGYASIGNPFSTPTTVTGNISNGALGYFGGYAVYYSTITIPE